MCQTDGSSVVSDSTPFRGAATGSNIVQDDNSSGSDFNTQDAVGITTSLLPLVALFSGGKSKSKPKTVARRPVVKVQPPAEDNSAVWLIGGAAITVLAIGAVAMSRK